MQSKFKVFDKNILFDSSIQLKKSGFFSDFVSDFEKPDLMCSIEVCDDLPDISGREVYRSRTQRVTENGSEFCRIIIDPLEQTEYACCIFSFENRSAAHIYIKESKKNKLNDVYYLWSILRPDVLFRADGVLLLHSSYIVDSDGLAILFSAPSGMGKTTQAELWRRFGGAKIINGDKSVLRINNDCVDVYGYPVAGTSSICLNEVHKLKAIVILDKSEKNIIRRLSDDESFSLIIKNIFIDIWNPNDVFAASRLTKQAVKSCSTYSFECLPDKSAFDALKKEIRNI